MYFSAIRHFLNSCGGFPSGGDVNSFHKNLRGTWVSNETGLYSGTLIINTDTITIDGYGEDWLSLVGDDSKRPFKDFPKRVALKGYSEEGKIFIKYRSTEPEVTPDPEPQTPVPSVKLGFITAHWKRQYAIYVRSAAKGHYQAVKAEGDA